MKDVVDKAVFGDEAASFTKNRNDTDLSRRVSLFLFLTAAGVATLIPLGMLALYEKSVALGTFDLSLAALLAANLLHARHYRKYDINIALGITFTAALFIFAFLTGGRNQSGFVWYYVFPLISSFLLGPRRGLAVNLMMLIPVLWLFLGGESHAALARYQTDLKLRFVPSYLVVVLFSYFAEQSREKVGGVLQRMHDRLEEIVLNRTGELREANRKLKEEVGVRKAAEEGLKEQVALLTLVGDVGRALTSRGTLEDVLRNCTDALVDHLGAAFARIWVLTQDGDMLVLKASSGLYTGITGMHSRIRVGELKIGQIALDGKPVLTNNVIGDRRVRDQEWAAREGMVAFAGHPLKVGGRLVGVMALFSRRALSASVLNSLAAVADLIAVGIDRKDSEEKLVYSREYLRSIVDTEPECVKLLDHEGRLVDMNPAGLAMLEVDGFDDVRNASILDFIKPEYRQAFAAYNVKVCRGEKCTLRFEIVGRKGTHRWLETRAVPFEGREGGPPYVLAVTRDITLGKKAEEELQRAKADLERQNEELKALDRMKSAFMYAVSHELKTPVSKHSMQLEILKSRLAKYDLDELERKTLAVMEQSIRRQQLTVRNLLDLSKLEGGKRIYKIEDFSLAEVFDEIRREYDYALRGYGIDFEVRVPPLVIRSDREMLWHVLSNVVHNAIKFRLPERRTRILARAEERNGFVEISISDNGVGMSAAEAPKAFESFFQASSSIEGTGVGLTICRLIVEGLGGRIRLESKGRNKGATVHLELPAGGSEES